MSKQVYLFENGTTKCWLQEEYFGTNFGSKENTEKKFFVDLDDDELRKVVDWYRKGRSNDIQQTLVRCINRFNEDCLLTKTESDVVSVFVGEKKFFSKRRLLEKLPGLRVMLHGNQKEIRLYRDEKMFEQILSWLRHPETFKRPTDFSFDEELAFFGVDMLPREKPPNITRESLNGSLEICEGKKVFAIDIMLNASPEINFFEPSLPTTSLFVDNYLRYTRFSPNTLEMERCKESGTWISSSNFLINSSHTLTMCFERQIQPTCLQQLFESVSVKYFMVTGEENNITFEYSARRMMDLAAMYDYKPFTFHNVTGGHCLVTVPIPTPSMLNPSKSIPFVKLMNCKVQIFRKLNEYNDVSVLHHGASLSEKEIDRIVDNNFEILMENTLSIAKDLPVSNEGRVESEFTWSLGRFICLSTLCISVYDSTTERILEASVKGTVKIGNKSYKFHPFLNQSEQRKLFQGKKYLPKISIFAEAFRLNTPSGHKSFSGDEMITISLEIDADSLSNLKCEVWGIFMDGLFFCNHQIAFLHTKKSMKSGGLRKLRTKF